jgi:very-short-patch-repair endonuclease
VESENLMYSVIRNVLVQNEFSQYEVVIHVPIRMILNDLQKLNTRELSFATNHLTHVDFLIFSKLTHQPIIVVEVDGFAYHNTEKQRERDQVKDTILRKYSIPIIRFSTIGSSENDKLISALRALNPDCGIKL